MIKLIVAGQQGRESVSGELMQRLPADLVTVRHSITLRADRGSAEEHELTVNDDDIIELMLAGGRRHWVRADELAAELDGATDRGMLAGSDTVRIPSTLALGTRQRGLGKWAIEALRVLGVDLAGSITDIVSKRIEGSLEPGPGLFRMNRRSADTLIPAADLDFTRPILVFLHGTASSTAGSFGDLWISSAETVAELFDRYDDQVLAFQHQTLTLSPIENALELLQALVRLHGGKTARASLHVDLVSHSRGGLVGEVLCRATAIARRAFDDDDHGLFAAEQYRRDSKALKELDKLMNQVDLTVSRFVRVACPARGTTLAGGRLDRYLSGMVNVLGQTTGLASSVLYDSVTTLMLGVLKKRTQPEELPGIEAMMPGSPTVRMLNRPDIQLAADLHVLGGDIEGSGIWSRLKVFITDLYYQEDHDLVVNTLAMLGGAARVSDVHYWLDEGAKVNHFLYFSNIATVSRLQAALQGTDDSAYGVLQVAPSAVAPGDYRKRTTEPQPIVFVLPGIMGSHLARKGERIWLDYAELARGGVGRLERDAPDIEPDGPIEDAYSGLLEFLSASHDVRAFAYDWRMPITESAHLLESSIKEALLEAEAHDMPVRIVAHSMGGLVVRAMLSTPGGKAVWERMCRLPGCRFIMLGTPNRGSHAIANMLIGRDSLLRKLSWLDFRNDYAGLQETVVNFDGVLELLPHDGSLDLFDVDDWQRLHEMDTVDRIERPDQRGIFSSDVAGSRSSGIRWTLPDVKRLSAAARLQKVLAGSPIDPRYMIYIAGTAPATADDITLVADAEAGCRVRVTATTEGDGRVTWASGIPEALRKDNLYYLDVAHGDLPAFPDAYPAIVELLSEGHTERLSRTPPIRRDAMTHADHVLLPEPAELYPDRKAILSAALGGRFSKDIARTDKVKVRVVHGNLARSLYPVLVGHYEGDMIVSAESYLDRQLNHRLRQRHALGLYPQRIGTAAVVLNSTERADQGSHPGAIVVGLGTFGDLTPGRLRSTIVSGVMQYALTLIEQTGERYKSDPENIPPFINVPVSALLVGTSSDIGVSDSLQSILGAIRLINQQLEMATSEGRDALSPARVDRVDIIELWEDKAVQATRALRRLCRSQDMAGYFDVEKLLVDSADGCSRASIDDREGWWSRMRVTVDPDGMLKFETFAERARIDSRLHPTQRRLVDQMVSRAASSATHDSLLSRTLFELLMPNELKEYAPDRRNMVMMLDDAAAIYPWELLQDGSDPDVKPLSVESAMIRQLVMKDFRAQPILAQEQSALVIGDPEGNKDSSMFPRLLGARDEAHTVARLLNTRGYAPVVELVGDRADALTVLGKLYDRPYQILHIAAHGVFEQRVDDRGRPLFDSAQTDAQTPGEARRISGVVLGDGMYLTPVEIENMRTVPQLVFINCCHLGRLAAGQTSRHVEYNRLAAGFARQLITMGVRAVVAAGWAVDDAAAATFASVFYEAMLGGEGFGMAVLAARKSIYDNAANNGSNTWGAYQCYGDPEFTLNTRGQSWQADPDNRAVSASELRQRIESLGATVQFTAPEKRAGLTATLDDLLTGVPESWLDQGSLCEAIADVRAELGDYKQAAEAYTRARTRDCGDVSLAAIEQMVNMSVRSFSSTEQAEALSAAQKRELVARFEQSEAMIQNLLGLHESLERWSIKGGVHKRWAMIASKAEQVRQLHKMNDAYSEAYRLGKLTRSEDAFYPLQNLTAARIALSWCEGPDRKGKVTRKELDGYLQELQGNLASAVVNGTSFWSMAREPDYRLLKSLANGILSRDEERWITAAYLNAQRRGGSHKNLQSVVEHARFFICVASRQMGKVEKRSNVCKALEELIAGLQDRR